MDHEGRLNRARATLHHFVSNPTPWSSPWVRLEVAYRAPGKELAGKIASWWRDQPGVDVTSTPIAATPIEEAQQRIAAIGPTDTGSLVFLGGEPSAYWLVSIAGPAEALTRERVDAWIALIRQAPGGEAFSSVSILET
jgi:hypothetical protein